jgi:hypothetical protein
MTPITDKIERAGEEVESYLRQAGIPVRTTALHEALGQSVADRGLCFLLGRCRVQERRERRRVPFSRREHLQSVWELTDDGA